MNTFNFLMSSLIIILLPGTGVIYTISTGISMGKRKSVFAAFGCTLGIIPHLIASIVLLSLFTMLNEKVFHILQYIGAAYLIYLGITMIIAKPQLNIAPTDNKNSSFAIIRRAVLINLLNPKLTLFFFSFLPQYASSSNYSYTFLCTIYGLAFMLLTFIVFAIYGMLAGLTSSFFNKSNIRLSIIQKIFGVVFFIFAVKLISW